MDTLFHCIASCAFSMVFVFSCTNMLRGAEAKYQLCNVSKFPNKENGRKTFRRFLFRRKLILINCLSSVIISLELLLQFFTCFLFMKRRLAKSCLGEGDVFEGIRRTCFSLSFPGGKLYGLRRMITRTISQMTSFWKAIWMRSLVTKLCK